MMADWEGIMRLTPDASTGMLRVGEDKSLLDYGVAVDGLDGGVPYYAPSGFVVEVADQPMSCGARKDQTGCGTLARS